MIAAGATVDGALTTVSGPLTNPTPTSTVVATPNLEAMVQKFQKLSYYDQHVVTAQCTAAVREQLRIFVAGNSSYLPLVEHISFLFDLMQSALNLSGLMDFILQVFISL